MLFEIEIKEGVAKFIINHPERRNAMSREVANGLESFLTEVEENKEIAYAVITGSENVFCSGGDLVEYQFLWTAEDAYPVLCRMASLLYRLATLPVPVIALVNGTAVGGGCEIATACDYRLMSRDAKAGFIQGTLGITTAWGGATLLFEKNCQHDRLLKMLSVAKLYNAEELHRLGWATELYDDTAEEGLEQFLQQLSNVHPSVQRAYKEVAIRKWETNALHNRMIEEVEVCSVLWEKDCHHEAVAKFLGRKVK